MVVVESGGVGCAGGLGAKQFGDGGFGYGGGGVIALDQKVLTFGRVDDLDQIDPLLGVGGDDVEDVEVGGGELFDGVAVKQVGGVFDGPGEWLGVFGGRGQIDQIDEQIKLGGVGGCGQHFDAQPGEIDGGKGVVLERERYLEQGVMRGGA
ncbi:hypothetical protein DE4576_05490 [Mycobacterium marinum]|nr:hypothetical protein DE4576_05490 [Mycobacterium marinum]